MSRRGDAAPYANSQMLEMNYTILTWSWELLVSLVHTFLKKKIFKLLTSQKKYLKHQCCISTINKQKKVSIRGTWTKVENFSILDQHKRVIICSSKYF